jgi:type II secretory pathway pseudopilin PulG
MTQRKRQSILVIVMLSMLSVAAVWALGDLLEQRDLARRSGEDLQACREMAQQIRRLGKGPTIAADREMQVQELGARIDVAASQASLPGGALVSRDSLSARLVRDLPYLRKPTQLRLRGVTLGQLTRFLSHLTGESGLWVQDLTLMNSSQPGPKETWDVTTTVTYLIYSPRASRGRQ